MNSNWQHIQSNSFYATYHWLPKERSPWSLMFKAEVDNLEEKRFSKKTNVCHIDIMT